MGQPAEILGYSIADYLEIERTSDVKHEFHDGEIFAMAGGTFSHNRLSTNTLIAFGIKLKGKNCYPNNSDQQIAISRHRYVYPDVSVICGNPLFYDEHPQAARNPVLIIEVLSDETESYDRGGKFMRYRQIPTFREYVLISQKEALVEVFFKKESELWEITAYEHLTDQIKLQSIGITIAMEEIYGGVVL